MRFIPLTSSVLECGWQMALIGFLLSPWVGWFKLFTLWLGRSANHLLFFFLIFYFFMFGERRREDERERNINAWLPLIRPLVGTWPTTPACALTGKQTHNPLVHRPALNPLSHSSQGANHLLLSVLGLGKTEFTRWLQTACLTTCLTFPTPLLLAYWPVSKWLQVENHWAREIGGIIHMGVEISQCDDDRSWNGEGIYKPEGSKSSKNNFSDCCGSVGWVSSCKMKERSLILFPVRAHAWVEGLVPRWRAYERQMIDISLSYQCFSPTLSPSILLSL